MADPSDLIINANSKNDLAMMRRFGNDNLQARYRRRCHLVIVLVCLLFAGKAHAYGASVVLQQRTANSFSYLEYGYSSLFRQGRDNFHWLDFTFAEYNYVFTKTEAGRARELGSTYRYGHRLRWARYFKPMIFMETGIVRRDKKGRFEINNSGEREPDGDLPDESETDYRIALGTGYLWERDSTLWMAGVKRGYIAGYKESYLGILFQFSFEF